MVQRIALGIIALALIVIIVLADVVFARGCDETTFVGNLVQYGSLLPIIFTLLALAGAVELRRLLTIGGHRPHALLAYVIVALLMLSPWLSAAELLGRRADQIEGLWWQFVWLAGGILATMVLQIIRKDPKNALRDIGATWLIIGYLGVLPSFAVQIRCSRYGLAEDGAWAILFIILVTKFSDIGGYLVGSTIGRHKLVPSISAGKTVEGTLGGILASVGLAVAFVAVGQWVPAPPADPLKDPYYLLREATAMPLRLGYTAVAITGLLLAVFGLVGDLFESCLKRSASRKDSSDLIPGYGGILDLTDSPWASIPVAWFLLTQVW